MAGAPRRVVGPGEHRTRSRRPHLGRSGRSRRMAELDGRFNLPADVGGEVAR